jgi:glucosamine-phosphate N-acetyltransferase
MKKTPSGETSKPPEIRELSVADLDSGFLETLGNLSDLEGLTREEARNILATMKRTPSYRIFVAVADGGQIVGTTTLLVERKFTHRGGLVGHIEDVVVRKGHEGRGVGGSLVARAIQTAKELGCYKCILDCKAELAPFYEGLGFSEHDVGMRIDLKSSQSKETEETG